MPKLIIDCKAQTTVNFILTLLSSIEEVAKDDINLNIVQDQVQVKDGRVKNPKVRYFSLAPEDLPNALLTLGEKTIIGILYADIVRSTVEAQRTGERRILETTRSLAERRHFNQKSLERSLVQLRDAGLLGSEPVNL